MKRFRTLGVMLVALLAIGALMASASSAAVTFLLAEWLLNGVPITTADAVENSGELNLINLNAAGFGIKAVLLCSGIFIGTVGPGSADEITELLNLALEKITATNTLTCTDTENCEGALVVAEGLPWKTELELMEDGTESFFADLLINGAYLGSCTILGVKVEEECKAPTTAIQDTNETGGTVDATFSDSFQTLAELVLGECGGRKETAEVTGLGITTPVGGGTLTVSE